MWVIHFIGSLEYYSFMFLGSGQKKLSSKVSMKMDWCRIYTHQPYLRLILFYLFFLLHLFKFMRLQFRLCLHWVTIDPQPKVKLLANLSRHHLRHQCVGGPVTLCDTGPCNTSACSWVKFYL